MVWQFGLWHWRHPERSRFSGRERAEPKGDPPRIATAIPIKLSRRLALRNSTIYNQQ
jgi:hypothetical protein